MQLIVCMAAAAARVDALQHALAAEADRVGSLLPVAHWALPTADLAASDERYENVRSVAHNLTQYVDDLDVESDSKLSPRRHDSSSRYFVNAEQQQSQRRLMFSVVDMLNEHAQRHEEAQQLLEAINPETAENLDKYLDDLELAAVTTSRVADFQVQSTMAALHTIGEQMAEKKRPRRVSSFQEKDDANATSSENTAVVGGNTAGASSGQAVPAASHTHRPSSVDHDRPGLDEIPTLDWDEEELQQWYEDSTSTRLKLEKELEQAQKILERSRNQVVDLQMMRRKEAERRQGSQRLPGARKADSQTQTDSTHDEAVRRELHKQLHAKDQLANELRKNLHDAEEQLGKVRKPEIVVDRPPWAHGDDTKSDDAKARGALSKHGRKENPPPRATTREGVLKTSKSRSAVGEQSASPARRTYLNPPPAPPKRQEKSTMTYGADADDESVEEARRLALEGTTNASHEIGVAPTVGLDASQYEQEITRLKERFSAEQQHLEEKITLLESSDSGRAISDLQSKIMSMRLGAKDVLGRIPMHVYAMLRGDAQVVFELNPQELAEIDANIGSLSAPSKGPAVPAVSRPAKSSAPIAADEKTSALAIDMDSEVIQATLDGMIRGIEAMAKLEERHEAEKTEAAGRAAANALKEAEEQRANDAKKQKLASDAMQMEWQRRVDDAKERTTAKVRNEYEMQVAKLSQEHKVAIAAQQAAEALAANAKTMSADLVDTKKSLAEMTRSLEDAAVNEAVLNASLQSAQAEVATLSEQLDAMTRERETERASMASNDAGEQMLKLAQAQQEIGQKSREIRSLNAKLRDRADEKIVAELVLSRELEIAEAACTLYQRAAAEALQSSDVADDTKQRAQETVAAATQLQHGESGSNALARSFLAVVGQASTSNRAALAERRTQQADERAAVASISVEALKLEVFAADQALVTAEQAISDLRAQLGNRNEGDPAQEIAPAQAQDKAEVKRDDVPDAMSPRSRPASDASIEQRAKRMADAFERAMKRVTGAMGEVAAELEGCATQCEQDGDGVSIQAFLQLAQRAAAKLRNESEEGGKQIGRPTLPRRAGSTHTAGSVPHDTSFRDRPASKGGWRGGSKPSSSAFLSAGSPAPHSTPDSRAASAAPTRPATAGTAGGGTPLAPPLPSTGMPLSFAQVDAQPSFSQAGVQPSFATAAAPGSSFTEASAQPSFATIPVPTSSSTQAGAQPSFATSPAPTVFAQAGVPSEDRATPEKRSSGAPCQWTNSTAEILDDASGPTAPLGSPTARHQLATLTALQINPRRGASTELEPEAARALMREGALESLVGSAVGERELRTISALIRWRSEALAERDRREMRMEGSSINGPQSIHVRQDRPQTAPAPKSGAPTTAAAQAAAQAAALKGEWGRRHQEKLLKAAYSSPRSLARASAGSSPDGMVRGSASMGAFPAVNSFSAPRPVTAGSSLQRVASAASKLQMLQLLGSRPPSRPPTADEHGGAGRGGGGRRQGSASPKGAATLVTPSPSPSLARPSCEPSRASSTPAPPGSPLLHAMNDGGMAAVVVAMPTGSGSVLRAHHGAALPK